MGRERNGLLPTNGDLHPGVTMGVEVWALDGGYNRECLRKYRRCEWRVGEEWSLVGHA